MFFRKREAEAGDEIDIERFNKKICTVRHLGEFKPEHFKDPTDFRVIKKHLNQHKKTLNKLHQQNYRLKKKVETLNDLLSKLHEKGLITQNAANDLKVSS